jgi:peptidoglycan/LPS O-acetylase OafA/YrhL
MAAPNSGALSATVDAPQAGPAPTVSGPPPDRIVALDGFRGALTLMVVVSHFFSEVANGFRATAFGWVAVIGFFVLSGFLVGRLILDKKDCANFLTVFFVRRLCRTIPVYVVCLLIVWAVLQVVAGAPWLHREAEFPLWSYLTFTQNFFMIGHGSYGNHWLSPTWTLTVEEQFYLIVPALFFLVPRDRLIPVFLAGAAAVIVFRAVVLGTGLLPPLSVYVLLPGVADSLLIGLAAAVLSKRADIDWSRHMTMIRCLPVVLLLITALMRTVSPDLFNVIGRALVGVACAAYVLSLVLGAPEAKSMEGRFVRFWGENSYSIYLTHLMVLGLMHGLILGTAPDVATWSQIAITVAALPIVALVGYVLTRIVEVPFTRYGRSWRWSDAKRPVTGLSVAPTTGAAAVAR